MCKNVKTLSSLKRLVSTSNIPVNRMGRLKQTLTDITLFCTNKIFLDKYLTFMRSPYYIKLDCCTRMCGINPKRRYKPKTS